MIHESIDTLKHIGKETTKKLNSLNIYRISDLLFTFPKSYEDYIVDNSSKIFITTIKTSPKTTSFKISKTTFKVEIDGTDYIAIAYRQPYLHNILSVHDKVIVKASFDKNKKVFIVEKVKPIDKRDLIEAQYRLHDIKDHIIRKALKSFFENDASHIDSPYDNIVMRKGYLNLNEALKAVHLPSNYDALMKGRISLKLFDAISFLKTINKKQKKAKRMALNVQKNQLEDVLNNIPFTLTDDQYKTTLELLSAMNRDVCFEYLIQGDVGSGKTIVSFVIALLYVQKGFQVAFMAPTEILARQHHESFNKLFHVSNVLLTGSSKQKEQLKKMIKNHDASVIFGTHALTIKDVIFHRLGVVIIDEQHKFGVKTRHALRKKSLTQDLLYLTATPIPRSLMHVIYGNADVLSIKTMPEGRQKVTTKSIHKDSLPGVIIQIEKAIKHHQHVFVVVPAISSDRSSYNIVSAFHKLKPIFKDDLFVIHGQMKLNDQQQSMQMFKDSKGGILLATSMIEVGVNIPTATFMVILDANYFGLSQLHQLRGRIGRGKLKGVCYIVSDDPENERLKQLETIQDGFELSELDLKLRGPGKLFGTIQSGNFNEGFIHIIDDFPIIQEAKDILSKAS